MNNLTDKEIMNAILTEHKQGASSMTNLILESSCDSVRTDATSILTRTLQHQKQIFDLMTQKGWYQVENASTQEVSKAQQQMSKLMSSM